MTTTTAYNGTPKAKADPGTGHPWAAISWLLFVILLGIAPALVLAAWRVLL